ncbi:cytochrome P450 4C1-like [Brevipalpus obovatus]|uniref:cytochrome P450 4C1-like n=1 Tax=Brevipalpus obovatus TaxID=246614 RepID=UPI003D9F7FC7
MAEYFESDTKTLITWSFNSLLTIFAVYLFLFILKKLRLCYILRNVPHRKSHLLFGDAPGFWKEDWSDPSRASMKKELEYYHEFVDRKLYVMWNMWTPILMVLDPQGANDILSKKNYLLKGFNYKYFRPWIGDGLLTSTSTKWHARRKLITPAFHFDILDHFAPIMIEHSKDFHKFLIKSSGKDNNWISINHHLSSLTLEVLLETTMGLTGEDLEHLKPAYVDAVNFLVKHLFNRYLGILSPYDFIYFRTSTGKEVKKALKTVHEFSMKAIQHRIEYLKQNPELNDETKKENQTEHLVKKHKRRALMDLLIAAYLDQNEISIKDSEDIREEIETFMFAGHDTTSSAIAWMIFLLGNNLDVQERLHQELKPCFQSSDENIVHGKITSNRYLDACVKESMRLFSPVPRIGKTLPEDTTICGHHFPKGLAVTTNLFFMHRNSESFPDPLKFKPDRFLDNEMRSPFSFIPFSAGPRNCIGQRFALLEMKIFIALLVHEFEFVSKDKIEDVEYCFEVVTRPIQSLDIKFSKRH